jgi:hypothetical protein
MSYKCDVCHTTSPPGRPRKTWLVLRPDGSVAREVPCCPDCHRLLASGRYRLGDLRALYPPSPPPEPGTREGRKVVAPAPEPPPPPPETYDDLPQGVRADEPPAPRDRRNK